jgi:hypothetical protein
MNLAALRIVTIALAIVAGSGSAAPAQTSLLKVTACDPQRSVAVPAYAGFSPAYYPFAPYFWTDPYGVRYRQFPAA